jgi:hypothetical protein
MCTRVYVCMCVLVRMCTRVPRVLVCMCALVKMCTCGYVKRATIRAQKKCTHTQEGACMWLCVCMHCVCVRVCMCVCVCACVYVCVCVCVY